MLEIDFDSESGSTLLAVLAERHGHAIAHAARLLRRLFVIWAPSAPGLRFVGGEADPSRPPIRAWPHGSFSLAGSGEALEDALASCIGEGMERLSQIEQPGDALLEISYEEAAGQVMPAARGLIEDLLGKSCNPDRLQIAWVRGHSLAAGSELLLPADWCLRRHDPGPLAIPGAALSTGCAAGRTYEAAAARALLELVERDAASLWWIGGQRPRPVAADGKAMTEAVRLLGILRQGNSNRSAWLLDITTDLNLPCLAALSVDADGRYLACGLAARLTPDQAARAAILEMCQMELGLSIVVAKRQQRGDEALNPVDRRHLDRATRIDACSCDLIHPLGLPRQYDARGAGSPALELPAVQAAFGRAGIEAALADLSRPDFGVSVVHAIAPQLQLMPGDLPTERLRRVISSTGGGERWTKGVALH